MIILSISISYSTFSFEKVFENVFKLTSVVESVFIFVHQVHSMNCDTALTIIFKNTPRVCVEPPQEGFSTRQTAVDVG